MQQTMGQQGKPLMKPYAWANCALVRGILCLMSALLVTLGGTRALAERAASPDCIVAAHYPPFMIADSAENAGLSIDILRAAAARAGRKIDITFMPFQRALHTLQTGGNCLMPALFRNGSRETGSSGSKLITLPN